MAFKIELLKDAPQFEDDGQRASWGLITLGDFEERFLAYTCCWRDSDYEAAWLDAVDLLLAGSPRSALVTDAHHSHTGAPTFIWPMWRVSEQVFVQNRMLLSEWTHDPLTLQNLISVVGERETVNEEGERISEWRVTLAELRSFRDSHPRAQKHVRR